MTGDTFSVPASSESPKRLTTELSNLQCVLHFCVIAAICIIVFLTANIEGCRELLFKVTSEGAFFELGSAAILFCIFFYSIYLIFFNRFYCFTKIDYIYICLFSFLSLFGGLEEISWGQRLFDIEPNEFFQKYNYQSEINFHNLVDNLLFATTLYLSLYIFFALIPLIFIFIDCNIESSRFKHLHLHIPELSCVLVFLNAFIIRRYPPGFFMEYVDMLTAFTLIAFSGYLVLVRKRFRNLRYILLLLAILFTISTLYLNREVLAKYNMQHEMNEFVVIYAVAFWFYNWTQQCRLRLV